MINDTTIRSLEERVTADARVITILEQAREYGVDEIAVVGSYVRDGLLANDEGLSGTYLIRQHLMSPMVGGMEVVGEGVTEDLAQSVAAALGGGIDPLTMHDHLIESRYGALVLGAARAAIFPADNGVPVHIEASIAEDLARRDFTINAMAVRVDVHSGNASFFDPFAGRSSLEAQEIRSLSPSAYREDAALVVRSAREEARFGFRLAPDQAEAINASVEERAARLAPPRLGAEYRMAWAVLDKFQMSEVLRKLLKVGFLQALDPSLAEADRLESVLRDIQLPTDLAARHSTADLAAAFSALLLSSHERAGDVAGRMGMSEHHTRLFQDTAELVHSMPRLLDPAVPHSEHHRELVYRKPLAVWTADVALNDGNTDLSRVHYYMERMGRYGADYRFGSNRIRLHLDVAARPGTRGRPGSCSGTAHADGERKARHGAGRRHRFGKEIHSQETAELHDTSPYESARLTPVGSAQPLIEHTTSGSLHSYHRTLINIKTIFK